MRVDEFDYVLDESRIALRPLEKREEAKLLLSTPEGLSDKHVADLPSLLTAKDLLVFNNTRVIPARLYGVRGMAKTVRCRRSPCGAAPPRAARWFLGGLRPPYEAPA